MCSGSTIQFGNTCATVSRIQLTPEAAPQFRYKCRGKTQTAFLQLSHTKSNTQISNVGVTFCKEAKSHLSEFDLVVTTPENSKEGFLLSLSQNVTQQTTH